ncbi:MAG TPA: hypothetical protein VK892_04355 [Pyrinomonadaceae bacterium]|nr:hypothetical protein [Pyrinomonadaceae bacterium]
MRHRHLKTEKWTLAAIDSAIERGDLNDWRELFAEARKDKRIAEDILKAAAKPDSDGAAKLAKSLIERMYPEISK